jgi:hypothetical protein
MIAPAIALLMFVLADQPKEEAGSADESRVVLLVPSHRTIRAEAPWPITNVEDAPWEVFASAPCDDLNDPAPCVVGGNPGVGHWAITRAVWLNGEFVSMLAAPEELMVYRIENTEWLGWEDYNDMTPVGYADLKTNYEESGHRFFAEQNAPNSRPVSEGSEVHNKIFVEVEISPPVVAGREPTVYFRVFDPDHYSDDAEFDPRDRELDLSCDNIGESFGGGASAVLLEPNPDQGCANTGAEIEASITIAANEAIAHATLMVLKRQPGNNFIVGAGGRQDWLNEARFAPNGQDIIRGDVTGTPGEHRQFTPILTIWRTTHIESDSMAEPIRFGTGPHQWDSTQIDEDPDPGDIAALAIPTANLQRIFAPAMIVVVADLTPYDDSDDSPFEHYLTDDDRLDDHAAREAIDAIRDVESLNDYWTIQVMAAYDPDSGKDNDPESQGTELGEAVDLGGDGPTVIFTESIRDTQLDPDNLPFCGPAEAKVPPPDGLLERVIIHEIVHRFDLPHVRPLPNPPGPGDEGILSYQVAFCGDAGTMSLTKRQLRIVQGIKKTD